MIIQVMVNPTVIGITAFREVGKVHGIALQVNQSISVVYAHAFIGTKIPVYFWEFFID